MFNYYNPQQFNQENQEPAEKKQKVVSNGELSSRRKGVLVNETVYYLNKSNSKWVAIGLSMEFNYEPVIKMGGVKNNQYIIFDENQWISFLNNQGVMLSFIHSNTLGWEPLQGNGYKIHFVFMGNARIIKITQEEGNEIFLAGDTINEAVNLTNLVKYRYDILKSQEFLTYYNTLVNGISMKNGDPIKNIYDVILPLKDSLNVCCIMELLHYYPNDVRVDVEIFSCNEFIKSCIEK